MPAGRLPVILPALARTREALERTQGHLSRAGFVPCVAAQAYKAARDRTLLVESLLIQEARIAGFHPPEDAPRSLPAFPGCPSGQSEFEITAASKEAAKKYLEVAQKRAAQADKIIALLYVKKADQYRAWIDEILVALSAQARAGTEEVMPAPRNVGLMRLLFYLGGSLWVNRGENVFSEADKFWRRETARIGEDEVQKLYREAVTLERAAMELAAADQTEPLLSTKGWALLLGGVSTLGALGGLAAWYYSRQSDDAPTVLRRPTRERPIVVDSTAREEPEPALLSGPEHDPGDPGDPDDSKE